MELLEQVESYLARSRVPPSTFGRMAVGDPRFVEDLRSGRRPRLNTRKRVYAYLAVCGARRIDIEVQSDLIPSEFEIVESRERIR
jgi:hypothetical protein